MHVNAFPSAAGSAVASMRLALVADKSHVTTEHARWIHNGTVAMNIWGYVSSDVLLTYRGKMCPQGTHMMHGNITGDSLKRKRFERGNNLKMKVKYPCGIYVSNCLFFK